MCGGACTVRVKYFAWSRPSACASHRLALCVGGWRIVMGRHWDAAHVSPCCTADVASMCTQRSNASQRRVNAAATAPMAGHKAVSTQCYAHN